MSTDVTREAREWLDGNDESSPADRYGPTWPIRVELVRELLTENEELRGEWELSKKWAAWFAAERDHQLRDVLRKIVGEPDSYPVIFNDWIVEGINDCTCYGGGPYGHEPGCGYMPIAELSEIASATRERNEARAALDRVRELAVRIGAADDGDTARHYAGLINDALDGEGQS